MGSPEAYQRFDFEGSSLSDPSDPDDDFPFESVPSELLAADFSSLGLSASDLGLSDSDSDSIFSF